MDWIDEEAARRRAGQTRPLLQSQHDAVNARYHGATLEYCADYDEPTGRAGRGEDSLYCEVCDHGPMCSSCNEHHSDGTDAHRHE